MIVRCPSCGAEVEFRYDDSLVRVCGHCRSAVLRTDRGVETLGQFADLVPIASALRLFAEGRYGTTGFQIIGMAQLRHASGGVWQEWYAKLDGGQWAWISEAQGRLYLTFERPDLAAPALAALAPGAEIELAGGRFTVAERSEARYIAALGEIPYRLVPGSAFRYADLADGRGGFATIDYGDGSEPPAVYTGYQVAPDALGLSGGEVQPGGAAPAAGARLACPNCNGSLELRAPDQSLRVVCPYCHSLVSVERGALSIIARQAEAPSPAIALGSTARFAEGALTVIGHVARSALIDGDWWPFEEYLLYAPELGFRWLVCSDGHWSYVQPVATGAVDLSHGVHYDGVAFHRFQTAELRVDRVLGEFYWRIETGERVQAEDYIAPPAMLSRESTASEQNWSLSSYLAPRAVAAAFEHPIALPAPTGVAPNQPYPAGVGKVFALAIAVLFALGIGKCASAPRAEKLRQQFSIPEGARAAPAASGSGSAAGSGDPAEPGSGVQFSDAFALEGGRNVKFDLAANVRNNWLYTVVDLVNDETGNVVSFDTSIEYYDGVDSDGSWAEGSTHASEIIAPVERGNYVLRIEGQHGGTGTVDVAVVVRQGVFRWPWFWLAFGVLTVPFAIVALHAHAFHRRRWSNSNVGSRRAAALADHSDSGGSDDD